MVKETEKKIQNMLYDMNNEEVLKEMDNIIDPEILYVYSYNYNWSDGFDIPKKIIEKECCDLSTALMIINGADGYRYLQEKNIQNDNLDEWEKFIKSLYETILNRKYPISTIKFKPPLNKVQLYYLKKILDVNEKIFVEEIGTKNLNIIL